MNCALCERPEPLRNSHIIPEFLYSTLYDQGHRMLGINGRGPLGRKILQKGLREPLLCEGCEQFLNDKYEKPFKKYWFDNKPLPNSLRSEGIHLRGIDYATFKLFHLSILFRCSVASTETFSDVALGPHEEKLRHMVRTVDPGQAHEYPVFAFALVDRTGSPNRRVMVPPFRAWFDGHIVYQMIFGGCMWVYTVSKHRPLLMSKIALQSSGSLWIIPERWEQTTVMQDVSKILRKRAKGDGIKK